MLEAPRLLHPGPPAHWSEAYYSGQIKKNRPLQQDFFLRPNDAQAPWVYYVEPPASCTVNKQHLVVTTINADKYSELAAATFTLNTHTNDIRERISTTGFYRDTWELNSGSNVLHLFSMDTEGNAAERTIEVIYDPEYDPSGYVSPEPEGPPADDVISEQELRERRKETPELEKELFVGLDDTVFVRIGNQLTEKLKQNFGLFAHTLLYDTTNFFTYIEAPARAKLANTGHNKDAHHHLRQVGLALCVDKQWGIPLFYRLYRGNVQDAKTFSGVVTELVAAIRKGFEHVDELVLVLDKGNNSEDNFEALKGKLNWIGSLVPTHHKDLLELPLDHYEGNWTDCRYHRLVRTVMGIECTLVLTYNEKLARKQQHSLENGIKKLKKQIRQKWTGYKNAPKSEPAGITSLIKQSRYGNYVDVTCEHAEPVFYQTEQTKNAIAEQRKRFGKNLLFANGDQAQAPWIIEMYRSKDRIEDGFKLLKHPELIRWRPCRHWTDTKIRAFAFCCIMAMVIIRVMERMTAMAGLPMSPRIIKEELDDLKEVIMLYDDKHADSKITQRSTVQQRLWELFGLSAIEEQITLH